MMNKTNIATIAAGLTVSFACAAGAYLSPPFDYSKWPSTAAEVRKQVDTVGIKLAQAIEMAQHETNGVATSAILHRDHDPAVYEVDTFSEDKAHKVFINAMNGEFFSNTIVDGPWTETESGLRYFDIKVGEGAQPDANSNVTVHYTGWLINGKKFDSSVDRGEPISFPLSGVIKGWTEGVSGMKIGGKRKLIIPYALAYGEMGRPPVIPAKATLVFDVELLGIVGVQEHDHSHDGHDHAGHDHNH